MLSIVSSLNYHAIVLDKLGTSRGCLHFNQNKRRKVIQGTEASRRMLESITMPLLRRFPIRNTSTQYTSRNRWYSKSKYVAFKVNGYYSSAPTLPCCRKEKESAWKLLPKGGWVRLRHRRWYALGQSFLSHITSSPPSPHWKQLSSCICFCSVFIFRFFCFSFAFFTFSSFAVANAV